MDVRDEQRLNLKDRIQADLEDGDFTRLEFVCVGMRQVLFGDLAADVIVNELRVGEMQYENEYKHNGKPAKRILISVKKNQEEDFESEKMQNADLENVAPNRLRTWESERAALKSSPIECILKKRAVRDAEIDEYPSPTKILKRDLRLLLRVGSQSEKGDLRGTLEEREPKPKPLMRPQIS